MLNGAFKQAKAAALTYTPMASMDEYLDELAANGRNPDYIRTVRNGLLHFSEYMRGENVMHPEEITRQHLVRFQGRCNQRVADEEWKKSYSIEVQKKVRAWLNWASGVGYVTKNPWLEIRLPATVKQPKPLSDDDLTLLLRSHTRDAFQIEPFIFHRRDVILCLLYAWGLRIHELEALTVGSMDMRLDFVTAKNKGGTTKTLPYTDEIKRIVGRWLKVRGQHSMIGEDSLLITSSGTRLPKEQIREIVTELGRKAGVQINPHRLRDTCGTHLLDSDVPAERVQKILGHANLKQTLAYSKVNNKKVHESLTEAMDPRLMNLFRTTRDLKDDDK